MKKVYMVDFNSEYNCNLIKELNSDDFYDYGFTTLKSAKEYMLSTLKKVKQLFAKEINEEKKNGNTITIDLTRYYVDDDWEDYGDDLWNYDHELIDSRYLLGRY